MQLYTRNELLKRAWIADSVQADLMIDAIEASYNGDVNTFDCLMNTVANLHWLSQALKCIDPAVGEPFPVVIGALETLQVSKVVMNPFAEGITYSFYIAQSDQNGVIQSCTIAFTTVLGDDLETSRAGLISSVNALRDVGQIYVTAINGTNANEILLVALSGTPIFYLADISETTCSTITIGNNEVVYTSSVDYSNRCLTDEQIQGIVLKVETICGAPCVPDPQIFLTDTIPNIIQYTDVAQYTVVYPVDDTPVVTKKFDFNQQDFKPNDFA
jgi:hypothetical protein